MKTVTFRMDRKQDPNGQHREYIHYPVISNMERVFKNNRYAYKTESNKYRDWHDIVNQPHFIKKNLKNEVDELSILINRSSDVWKKINSCFLCHQEFVVVCI